MNEKCAVAADPERWTKYYKINQPLAKVVAATKAATIIELGSVPWFKGGLATVQARTSMKHLKSAGEMYSANTDTLELTVIRA
jgi:hypothetical protein